MDKISSLVKKRNTQCKKKKGEKEGEISLTTHIKFVLILVTNTEFLKCCLTLFYSILN